MDSKDGKKKESIDDILADLNGLLNKMPSILDGIRVPELQPGTPAPKPEEKTAPPADDADKTIVLQAFADLPEGAKAPEEKPEPEQAPAPAPGPAPQADADKTMVIESFSRLPEGAAAPEAAPAQGQLVPQSLGDFMFGEEAEKPAPAAQDAIPGTPPEPAVEPAGQPSAFPGGPSLSFDEFIPPAAEPPQERPEASLAALRPEETEPAGLMPQPEPQEAPPNEKPAETQARSPRPYDTTRDFGIPDIDALMQLSGDEKAPEEKPVPVENAQPEPEPAVAPAAEQTDPAAAVEPSMDELAEFERQLRADALQQGGNVENDKPEEEKSAAPQPEEIQPSPAARQEPAPLPAAEPTGFEAFTIEPSAPETPVIQDGGEVSGEPSAGPAAQAEPAAEPLQDQPQAEPAAGTGQDLVLEAQPEAGARQQPAQPAVEELASGAQPEALPETQAAASQPEISAGGLELPAQAEITMQGENTLQFHAAALSPEPAPQGGNGIELEPASAVLSVQAPASPSGDETLVVAPPREAAGGEDKTIISEAAGAPGITSRSQAGDLSGLASRPIPEGIPEDRVKSLVFLYALEEKALCASVLSELDAICLKSATKPMFVRRAAVRECEPDISASVLQQSVADLGAAGVICVGAIPVEKVYEIENVFSSSGGFFRHFDSSSFSHSAALDLVSDLILR